MIYHYTTIQNLALILKSGKIRFSRLDQVDDLTEQELSEPFNPLPYFFVSCWEKTKEENPALWHMYSDKTHGVRIGLPELPFALKHMTPPSDCGLISEGVLLSPLSFPELCTPEYCILPIFGAAFLGEVEYAKDYIEKRKEYMTITINERYPDRQNLSINFHKIPRVKNTIWRFQNEFRFSLLILPPYDKQPNSPDFGINLHHHFAESVRERNLPTKTYFDLSLDKTALDSIEVTLAPCAEESDKLVVQSLVSTYTKNGKVQPSSLRIR